MYAIQPKLFEETAIQDEFTSDDYETPNSEALKMASLIQPWDSTVLEPTAGTGQIMKHCPTDAGIYYYANEIKRSRYEEGKRKAPHCNWTNYDFLKDWEIFQKARAYDLIISNLPFSLGLEIIEISLKLLNFGNPNSRCLFLLPTDFFQAKGIAHRFNRLGAYIHHKYELVGRVDYLKNGTPMSKQVNPKTGEKYGSRQVYDAVFDIRPGKQKGAITLL